MENSKLRKWETWGIIFLAGFFSCGRSEVKTQNANSVLTVDIRVIESHPWIEELSLLGNVLPNEGVALRFETAGRIEEILFQEGQSVECRQLLVQLDKRELTAKREKLLLDKSWLESRIARQQPMLDQGSISRESMDQTVYELGIVNTDLSNLDAQIRKTEIRAPFAGRVGLRQLSVGAFVQAGMEITELVDISRIKLSFAVPEQFASRIKTGNRLDMPFSDRLWTARIYALSNVLDETTRSRMLHAVLENPPRGLLPGMMVEARIQLDTIPHAILIPSETIVSTVNSFGVYICSTGTAAYRPISTGWRDSVQVQILSGLNDGDSLITSALMMIKPGSRVQLRSSSASSGESTP